MPAPPLHFGVMYLPSGRTWPEIRDAARRIEALGFDSFWIPGHVSIPGDPRQPLLEPWALLAALAAVTERLQLGTLVTPAGLYPPTYLAKVVATADQIGRGRIIPGLGAGWAEKELADYGMPFYPLRERLDQLRETAQFLRRAWGEPSVTFDGRYVRAVDVECEPKPMRPPPILIAAGGEQVALRIAAEEADIWNNSSGDHEYLERNIAVLRQHCATVGRDATEIVVSQQCLVSIAPDAAGLDRLIEQTLRQTGRPVDVTRHPLALTGTLGQIGQQIEHHRALGCSMLVLDFFGPDLLEPATLFAETVLPGSVRSQGTTVSRSLAGGC